MSGRLPWPSIRYGIGTTTNDMEEAEELLNEFDCGLLNILGIARTVKVGWRKLHSTFGGFKIMNLATEQLIERLNLLLQHYNTATPSSSPSSIHYGHYKASAENILSSKIHVQQLTVIARSGVAPERWGASLQVLLEKLAGMCLVEKLKYIQLYEADFNFFQQFIFGRETMNTLMDRGLLPEEHFSNKAAQLTMPNLTKH